MILITGGAGFIGSAWVWHLNQLGEKNIVIVDHLGTSDKWRNLVPLNYSDYIEKDDFLTSLKAGLYKGQFSEVYHLGACSATTESDASYLIHNNFEYSKVLLNFCTEEDITLYYASSAATYGDGGRGYSDFAELSDLRPLNMYGYSKHMFDRYVHAQGLLDKVVGLKFFNVWGPNEYHKGSMRSMVVKAYEQIQQTGKVQLFKSHHKDYEDGRQMRDFVYIKDVVRMMQSLRQNKRVNGLINIGSGNAHTWIDLINPIFEALELESRIEFIDMPPVLREKYQYFTQADMRKYDQAGLERFETPLSDAVQDFVMNYLRTDQVLGY